jgi:diguanylate cyclase (GGDEF)-like protein
MVALLRWILVACVALGARGEVLLSGDSGRIDPWPHIRVLSDPAGTLTAQQAAAQHDRFAPPAGAYATLGMKKEVVWLRIPVAADARGGGEWILDIDYALLRRIDVHVVNAGKVTFLATLGNDTPFAERPLPGRAHAVPITFAPNSASELLLRLDTPGGKILPITLNRHWAYQARILDEQLIQGAFACLGFFLLVFSLAQWLSLREDLYLKYALLVICSTLFCLHLFGIGEMYLWSDHEWPDRHMAGVTALLAATATALFIEEALEAELHRWLRRGLLIIAVFNLVAALAYGTDLIDIQTVAVIMSTTGIVPALMGLPGAVTKARRGDAIGAWFLLAWVGYFIASVVLVGVVRGYIGVNFWTMHSFQIGATLDMLVFLRIATLRTAARHREAQRAAHERDNLRSLAHTDPLTGLLNRRGLDDVLVGAIQRATPEHFLALYALDLDGFKPVNDRFGHDVGDDLLRAVAGRLRGSVRSIDGVARVGGDEFVVVAEGLTSQGQAIELGDKLLDAFRELFRVSGEDLRVGATIGYALAPNDHADAGALMKAADAAMYAGKQEGKFRLVHA